MMVFTSGAIRLGIRLTRAGAARDALICGDGRSVCAAEKALRTKPGTETKRANNKLMQYAWYDLIGTVGVGIIISTYVFLQLEKIRSESLLYSLLNAVGASLIIVSLVYNFNFSAFIVEFFWVLISLYGIVKYFLKK